MSKKDDMRMFLAPMLQRGSAYVLVCIPTWGDGNEIEVLEDKTVIRDIRITVKDGKNYNTKHYNLSGDVA